MQFILQQMLRRSMGVALKRHFGYIQVEESYERLPIRKTEKLKYYAAANGIMGAISLFALALGCVCYGGFMVAKKMPNFPFLLESMGRERRNKFEQDKERLSASQQQYDDVDE